MALRKTIPSDRYTVDEALRRGREADAILNSEIYREVIERARERFYDDWLRTSDQHAQYAAWAKSHALEAVNDELRAIIADGEVAASEVED